MVAADNTDNSGTFVAELIELPTYRAMRRWLRACPAASTSETVQALVAQAHAIIRSDPRRAELYARLGRQAARGCADASGELDALRAVGQALILQGRFGAALRFLDLALLTPLARSDQPSRARLEALRMQSLTHLERYEEAARAGSQALLVFEDEKDRGGWVRVQMALADLSFRLDQPRDALSRYHRVEARFEGAAPVRLRGALAANRGNALEACNRFHAAERQFRLALDLFESASCDHAAAQVEYNAAYADALSGKFQKALQRLASVEDRFLALEDERHLAHVDLDRAEIHAKLNLPEETIRYAEAAGARFADLGLGKECAQAIQLAAWSDELRGRGSDAEAGYLRAEGFFRELGLVERGLGCLLQRAGCLLRQGRLEEARELADQADALATDERNPLARAATDLLFARLYLATGEVTRALHTADEVRTSCRRVHAPPVQIEAHRIMGRAYVERDQFDEAILAFKHAIDHLEAFRGGVPPDEFMAAFLAGKSELYEEIVDLLVRSERDELAFEYAERAKSRALVDMLAGRVGGQLDQAWASTTTQRIRILRERLNGLYGKLFRADVDARGFEATEQVRDRASSLESELSRLLRAELVRDPHRASIETVAALDLSAVRSMLQPGEALVEYFVAREVLYTFVVSPDSLRVVRQDVPERELRRLMTRFRFHLGQGGQSGREKSAQIVEATRDNLGRLAAILIEPIEQLLPAGRMIVVPHGLLHALPFHALPHGEEWLIDRCEVVYAPSAAVYAHCLRADAPADGPLGILALPDEVAPQIESEARQVADADPRGNVFLREKADLPRLRSEARRARVLHVATHGMFRPEQPMLSSIRLADGWINLHDLYRLEVKSEVVVLSTCESGIADVGGGDEILGLTRGFLYSGARVLLASQWRVSDEATTELMAAFHRNLARGGDPVAAHRAAMRETRKRWPHPCFWAPFFLTGGTSAIREHGVDNRERHERDRARGERPRPVLQGSA